MSNTSTNGNSIYHDVVEIAQYYFGPVSERFISRQIRNHLHKEPEQLKKKDLEKLTSWMTLVMSLLVDDEELVKSFISELKQL